MNENSVNSNAPFPFLEMGTSFIIGLAVGFFLKKFFKFMLLILGLGLVVLFYLESKGTVHVDGQVIESGVSSGVDSFQHLVALSKEKLSQMSLSSKAGALAGFFAGIKFG
jgi:uncharacterized membrane protein (Fun14 family)